MRLATARFALPAIALALLALLRAFGGPPPAYAVPPAAITPTATAIAGRPTLTPSTTPPATSTAQATNTPSPRPTRVPRPKIADPAVTKAASLSEARAGDIVVFTLTVTNRGNASADNVVVTDALPDFLDLIDADTDKGVVAISGRTVVVTIGTVAPAELVTIHVRARVNALAQPPGGRNSVTLTTSSGSDDPSNDSASVALAVLPPAATATATPMPTLTPATGGSPPAGGAAGHRPPPKLPPTGAADEPASRAWPLALLGLAALGASLLVHRRRSLR